MKGTIVENYILASIQQKCEIKTDPVFDHKYKLDFVVNLFKNIPRMISVGVQVTTRLNDAGKLSEFLKERKKGHLVSKSVYLEIDPDISFEPWVSELLYVALVDIVFRRNAEYGDIIGVRINPDFTYEFFDLEKAAFIAAEPNENTITGKIIKYKKSQGWGLIESGENKWFFRGQNIIDDRLKNNFLPNLEQDEFDNVQRPVYVDFEDGGMVKDDAKFPVAQNVRLKIRR